MSIVSICGQTFMHKEELKKKGCSWNVDKKLWQIISDYVTEGLIQYCLANNLKLDGYESKEKEIELSWPEGLQPYPYQIEGAKFALQRASTLIADEMGLGKTIQALLVLRHTHGTCLIVCPASIKLNWLREIRKWCPERESFVTISSWASLHKVKDKTFDLVIADESHYAKNPDSKRTKNMKQICLKAGRKVFLTGTPILAHPIDIFSLIDMAKHPLAKNWHFFARRYCGMYQDNFGNMAFGEPKNLDELKENLKGFMIRRVKSEVLDFLPPKVRSLLDLEIEDEYIKALIMAEGVASNRSQITEKKKKLFEKHNIEFNQLAKVRSELGVVKAPAVIERIKEMMEEVESLVVFWTHRKPLHMCMEALQEFNPVCVVGDMKVEERQEAVDLFQKGKARVIFLTFGAGAEGITLTKAQNMIMAELDWTPSKLLQAEDRCHRISQKGSVHIEYITFAKSIDHKILRSLMKKTSIINQILDGEDLSSLAETDEDEE